MQLKFDAFSFLKKSDLPWIKYNIGKRFSHNSKDLAELRKKLLDNSKIKALIEECKVWPEAPLKRHNDAKHIIHKMCLLIDFGLNTKNEDFKEIVENILKNQSEDGAFLSMLDIPKNYGGSGQPALEWLLCDFPILLYILVKNGYKSDERIIKAISFLESLISENGWHCLGSVKKFRGPGRKADHCPYATLLSLKVFSLLSEYHDKNFIKIGIDAILNHWEIRTEKRYYLFAMGSDFKKLKYPNIWFNIVNVCKVLSKFAYARESRAFQEMLNIIINKQQENGGFIPESIYTAYKDWDFGQKKEGSPSLTYSIWEMFEDIQQSTDII